MTFASSGVSSHREDKTSLVFSRGYLFWWCERTSFLNALPNVHSNDVIWHIWAGNNANKGGKLSQRESKREQHKSQMERCADLRKVLNAFAELMTDPTWYLICSHRTLGSHDAVFCVDSLTFLSKVYSSLQKGTSPQILCHYSLAVFSDPSAKTHWIKHLDIYLGVLVCLGYSLFSPP